MSSSVYWIHHPDHTDMFTQGYVGVTNNIKVRWNKHKGQTQNSYLKNAITKYGWSNLIKEVVVIASEAYCLLIESKLRYGKEIGWNIIEGGGMPPKNTRGKGYKILNAVSNTGQFKKGVTSFNKGIPMSEDTKLKLNKVHLGTFRSAECRLKMSILTSGVNNPNYGKVASNAVRLKQSLAKLGKPSPRKGVVLSNETKLKISIGRKGHITSDATRLKLSISNSGREHKITTCPHCNVSGGVSAMPRWHFDNCKRKVA